MKKVTRTIESHKIVPAVIKVENGQVKTIGLEPITVTNVSMNEQKALKFVQKKYGKENQYAIIRIVTEKETWGLDIEKFMELAERIEN